MNCPNNRYVLRFGLWIAVIAVLGLTGCINRRNLTTSASTGATTGYLVHRHNKKDHLAEARAFAAKCPVALRRDAAAGGGEHLDALADLLGASDHARFGRWMQAHYARLYRNPPRNGQLVDRVVALRRGG